MVDLRALRESARSTMAPAAWSWYQANADPAVAGPAATSEPAEVVERDHQAWAVMDLVPRVMRGITAVDTSLSLGGTDLAMPITIAPTAAHRLAHPDGEVATAAAAAEVGALMTYSSSAAVEVTAFGSAATGPWWAQVYLLTDRGRTIDYLDRLVAAGARAAVLTVDHLGSLGDAPFRRTVEAEIDALPGNFPGLGWKQMGSMIEPAVTPDDIGWLAGHTGLPVWVKGVMHPLDAAEAVKAGAAGIVVSNHGRRQLADVIPTARALPAVLDAVSGAVPVIVDGGIRTGVDVLRALALGATAVGLGRPVLWALAAGGRPAVIALLRDLTAELRQAMASAGAADLSAITADLTRMRD